MMDDFLRLTSNMANLTTASSTVPPKADKSATIFAQWCSKKHLNPQFKFQVRQDHGVICELMVPGCKYKGLGYSKTKGSAKEKATKDFILFLVRQKALNVELSTIPEKIKKTKDLKMDPSSKIKESKTMDKNCLSAQKKNPLYDVCVNKDLMNDVYSLLKDLNIKLMISKEYVHKGDVLLLNQDLADVKPPRILRPLTVYSSKVVVWTPPRPKWNPWLGISIKKSVSLTELSSKMERLTAKNKERSSILQKRIKDRADLPIFNKMQAILDIIENNSVVIVHGGTGCGKTTQVCQFILDKYIHTKKGAHCNIICTQPRKVSAISIAKRVAYERAEALGNSVGYTVRFDSINPRNFGAILFCTTEILIRKLINGLNGISHVIVDEIHERRADSEFLLIILKDMVQKYPDLKVILMSANANLKVFSKYFNNCPIIDVKGRCYPVKEYFLEDIVQMLNFTPTMKNTKKKKNDEIEVNCNLLVSDAYPINIRNKVALIDEDSHHLDIIESLLIYIEKKLKMKGAVLIFLPGWAWISELDEYLQQKKSLVEKFCILPLHSTLSHAEQHKVFMPAPHGKRKIILSTNIAETSVTIDDVVFVIDLGKAKTVEFSNNVTTLNTVWASKVNVEQRKGRAGRVQAGICFNLYTKERFNRLDDNISPELINCSLSKIGLTIKLLQLGDINKFLEKAIDPPPKAAVDNVITMLNEMKCLSANGELTALGNILAQLPVEPQLGRMMILGNILMLGDSLSTIAAGSSIEYDIFIGNHANQPEVRHHFSGNRCSDQLVFFNAFMQWDLSDDYCTSADNDFFEEYGISTSGLKTINSIKNQIIKKFLSFGFPKICFKMQDFDFVNTGVIYEPQLDMIPALLTMAFYPNVYYHKENRKVNLKSKDFAVVSRHSVNYPRVVKGLRLANMFHSPFFVFEQQVNVMCLHSTMVTPIHLILFGACKVEYNGSSVVLDDWIYLKMDVKVAAAIVALRPAIDDLIVRTAENPKLILKFKETDIKLINILTKLCNYNAGRHNLSPIRFD